MAVSESGAVSGAVSGGCVEGAVVEVANEVLRGAGPQLLHFGIADSEAWDVGLPCGGEIDVFVETDPHEGFARVAAEDGRAALVTVIAGPSLGARLLVRADGESEGSLGAPELDKAGTTAAEELMWEERSERRDLDDVALFVATSPPRRRDSSCSARWTTRRLSAGSPGPPVGGPMCATRARSSRRRSASRTPRRSSPHGPTRRLRGSGGSTAPLTWRC